MKILKVLVLAGAFSALILNRVMADTPVFFESFEAYLSPDFLSANYAGGNNTNGPGGPNPWWTDGPPGMYMVKAETLVQGAGVSNNVTPHTGTNMVRAAGSGGLEFARDFLNVASRYNSSNAYAGNLNLDWWFYDPVGTNAQRVNYQDYGCIANYPGVPNNTDYPTPDEFGFIDVGQQVAQLALGASDSVNISGLRTTNYQAQVLGTTDTNAFDTSRGWFNLPIMRSVGWHHAMIKVSPALTNGTVNVSFYIDDLQNALLTNNSAAGFNCIVLQSEYAKPITGWYDDLTLVVPAVEPPPSPTIAIAGTNAIVTWPGTGFTLQTSTNLIGTNFVDVPSAKSPYTNSLVDPQRFFRLRQ